jgi:hypothetical protein
LQRAELHAVRSCHPGIVDPSTALLIEQCNQLVENASSSYKNSPHNTFHALVWLQHAFLLCRAFESEKFVEKAIAFEHKRSRVGSTLVSDGNGRSWSEERLRPAFACAASGCGDGVLQHFRRHHPNRRAARDAR